MDKVIANCCICGQHKEVHELIRDKEGQQKIVLLCDSCIKWMEEVVNEYKQEYEKKHCYECANYNIGDGVDNINQCYKCKFHIK